MSGHSKWHNIQKTKGAADAKRAQAFTKLTREMIVAVKEGGGGDPRRGSAHDHHVVGVRPLSGREGQQQEQDVQQGFHGRRILTLNSRVSRLKPRTTSVYVSSGSLSSAVSMRTVRLSPGIRQMKLSV